MATMDSNGAKISGYNYTPYGIVSGSDFSQQPFGYSTKRSDFASGLVYFGYRFYMPNLGRWLNRDPLQEQGGINLYAYVNGDPLGYVDPDGRNPIVVGAAAVAAVGYMAYLVYDKLMDFVDASKTTDEILDRQNKAYEDGNYSACFNKLELDYRKSFIDTAVKGANFAGSVPGTVATGPFPTTGVDIILAGSSTVVVEAAGE